MRSGFSLAGLVVAVAAAAGGDPPRVPFPPPDRPQEASASGEVTAVDTESITVRGFDVGLVADGDERYTTHQSADRRVRVNDGPHVAWFGQAGLFGKETRKLRVVRSEATADTLTLYPADGGKPEVLKLADQPERKFLAVGPLAEGGYKKTETPANTYRLADVRVGDRVKVSGIRRGAGEYAETVMIRRRPGGRVPEAPGEATAPLPDWHPRWHERMNAEQDLEERGIPLPKGYHEGKRWVQTAPPPREARRP